MSKWIEIGRVEDIPQRGARILKTEAGDIAVFRCADDRVFALDDKCPHRGGPLSQGIVHGWKVTCPMHNWVIELANGHAVAPDEGRATKHPVRIKDGVISLRLAARLVT
ncbi:MAG TPA: nitrite reductase small subunit NirD [Rhodospirillaceae bacterium]|nr:nitrite reductase small subunit NirD [Rhodospirillales bacterium]HIJ44276.1 nitrite reductase small subunit NirD [Rhodospirillaceae bacterium]MDP7215253.1 nitrite reductase small subunit NirD [Rhodospirillales bacterium]HIJ45423.1 nitrite reductase small subunit NirD [Rhodospirillaceae bacterium]HIJ93082.1 nitrite reductase small subunit NirD [Rhodospirillaceae bacterium]